MDLLIETYGPLAVFFLLMLSGIGIPLGEDVIVIPAGVLVATGKLPLFGTLLAAYTGVIAADMLWFFLCTRYGTQFLHKRWVKRIVHPKRLLQAKHQIERRGVWFMVIARFVPSSRTTAITVSGLLQMEWWKFFLVEVVCVAFTAPLQIGIGYLIGKGIGTEKTSELIFWLIGLVVVLACIPFVIGWYLRHRSEKRELPRAKAKWLRRFRQRRAQVKPQINLHQRG